MMSSFDKTYNHFKKLRKDPPSPLVPVPVLLHCALIGRDNDDCDWSVSEFFRVGGHKEEHVDDQVQT